MEEQRLGQFQLLRCLGEGGMGKVYLARDNQLEREVAIKVIAPELIDDPELIARFRVEAIAQARLSHPNIVTIYSFLQTAGTYIIVMEYVAGKNLKQLLQEKGKLPLQTALHIASAVLDALSFAHAKGILHRDIKPANILITPEGRVKLGDFGIAKIEGLDGLTRIGTMLGTPFYSSPEQIRAMKVSPATDIYSLTVTLYEMLSGTLPFGPGCRSSSEVQKAHLEREPLPLASFCPGLPARLESLISKGLAKKPEQRFPSARDYHIALDALIKNRHGFAQSLNLAGLAAPIASLFGKIGRVKLVKPAINSVSPRNDKRWLLFLLVPLLLLLLLISLSARPSATDTGHRPPTVSDSMREISRK